MFSRIPKLVFLILILALVLPNFFSFAQLTPQEEKQQLEKELKELEEKIAQYAKDITKTEQETKTLKNQIYILKNKIEKLELEIRQSNAIIKELKLEIVDTEGSIEKTVSEIENSKKNLATLLRTIYKEDQKSDLEILLSGEKISDYFNHLVNLQALNLRNQEILGNIETSRALLENQKKALAEDKDDLERMVTIQMLQKKESEEAKKNQEYLRDLNEAQYQKYLKEKEVTEKKAAEIRTRIFELIGVAKAPTFGEAYELAKYVEKITGVRPAFLLAVLTQESNIGKNVGQCYLKDFKTGVGVRILSGEEIKNVMKPSRDIEPFLQITKELGRDPYNTPVSCPIPSVGGYGGAMGPAQFIPSTWINYRESVSQITGKPADPWDIKDAFLAAALYLAKYGATNQTTDAEWQAAMIYFSGTTNKKYQFYGNLVLSIAKKYEEDIKALEAGLTFGEPKLLALSFLP